MGNLSSAKVRQLEAINNDYRELTMMVRDRSKGVILKADRERLRLLEREKRADLAAVLTPEELTEYDLRGSLTANGVRSRLRHFEPSEAEFRALTGLQLELDLKFGISNLSAEEQVQRRAAEKELLPKIQGVLSPERFAEYQITIDGAYSQTTSFLTAAKLDPKLAHEVIGIKQELTRRADAIREDASLPTEQKNAQIALLEGEATSRLTAALGEPNFATYKKNIGSWITRLNPKPAPASRSPSP